MRTPSANATVAIEVGANVPLESGDHLAEEPLRLLEIPLEEGYPLLECPGSLTMIGNLTLLIQVPEQSHDGVPGCGQSI
jgi:hypothetical protein